MTTHACGGVALPHVFMHVIGCAGCWSPAVDYCSSRPLLSKKTAEALGVAVQPVTGEAGPLTAIDGMIVQVLGTAHLTMSGEAANVHMPEVSAEFRVVKSLDVVVADLLIGIDTVSSSLAGVQLEHDRAGGELTKVTFGANPQMPAAVSTLAVGEDTDQRMPKHVSVAQDEDRVCTGQVGFRSVSLRMSMGGRCLQSSHLLQ